MPAPRGGVSLCMTRDIAGVGVGDGDGQGVGGIRRGRRIEAAEGTDHDGNLGFAGGAASGDGGLDSLWGIFDEREAVPGDGEDRGAAGAAEGDGHEAALDVDGLLDGGAPGRVRGDDVGEGVVDGEEAGAEGHLAGVGDDAVCQGPQAPAAEDLYDTVAGAPEGGIDAEDNISGLEH